MKVERDGLGYVMNVVSEGVVIGVDMLTDRGGDTYGELTVARAPEGHLMQSRMPITSISARKAAADYLRRRSGGVDWTELLESFCVEVLRQERQGDPPVVIGKIPPRPKVEFVLEPMVIEGKPTILFGEGGTGKSTIAAAVAVAVASGTPTFTTWYVDRPRPVMVLDWEADAADWNDLVASICNGHGIEPPPIIYQPMRRRLTADIHRVSHLVGKNDVGLIIVDSVGLASPAGREGASAEEGALMLFQALGSLRVASLLIDHVSKATISGDGSAQPYGSVYKTNSARATYELRASEMTDDDGTRHVVLFHRKHNLTARQSPIGIMVRREPGRIELSYERPDLNDAKVSQGATQEQRIMAALSARSLSAGEVEDATGIDEKTARVVLGRLTAKGLLVRIESPSKGEPVRWGKAHNSVVQHVARGVHNNTPPTGEGDVVVSSTPRSSFASLAEMNQHRGGAA